MRWAVLSGVVGLALGGLFAWLALRGQDWSEVAAALGRASLPGLLLGLGLVFATGLIRAYRWRLLLVRERVSVARLYVVEHAGIGANSISPVRVVSEPVQFGLLTLRDRLRSADVVASLSLKRALDLAATVLLVGAGLLLLPALAPFGGYAVLAAVVAGLLVLSPFLLVPLSVAFPKLRGMGFVRTFLEVAQALREHKGRVLLALGVTVAYWLSIGGVGWLMAEAAGIGLSPFVLLVLSLSIIFLAGSVPGLPGAFGTFELATIFLLGLWDVPQEVALVFAVAFHLVLFLPPVAVATVALPMEGVRSIRAVRGLALRYWEAAPGEGDGKERQREEA